VAAEANEERGQTQLDDAKAGGCDRQRADHPDERPGGEGLDPADLPGRHVEHPQRRVQDDEARELIYEDGSGDDVPPSLQEMNRALPKTGKGIAAPAHGASPHELEKPRHQSRRQISDATGEAIAPEAEHEPDDNDHEDREPDHGDDLERLVALSDDGQERESDDREPEEGELVPHADDGEGQPNGLPPEAPAAEHAVRDGDPPRGTPRGGVGGGRPRLGEYECLPVAEPWKRAHPRE